MSGAFKMKLIMENWRGYQQQIDEIADDSWIHKVTKKLLHPRARPKTKEEKALIVADAELLRAKSRALVRPEHLLYNYATENRAGIYGLTVSAPKSFDQWVESFKVEQGAGPAAGSLKDWEGWINNVYSLVTGDQDKERLNDAREGMGIPIQQGPQINER